MWNKCDEMIVRGQLPYNAEPPPSVLARSEITAIDVFYAGNHGAFPDIPAEEWQLTVDGLVYEALTVNYEELTTSFTQHSVVATLVCAGNRRAELLNTRPIPGKDPWEHGAISTAQWRGVRLADVPDAAGVHRRRADLAASRPSASSQPVGMAAVVTGHRRRTRTIAPDRARLGRHRRHTTRMGGIAVEPTRVRQQRVGAHRMHRPVRRAPMAVAFHQ